jgi:hypothetical protein
MEFSHYDYVPNEIAEKVIAHEGCPRRRHWRKKIGLGLALSRPPNKPVYRCLQASNRYAWTVALRRDAGLRWGQLLSLDLHEGIRA